MRAKKRSRANRPRTTGGRSRTAILAALVVGALLIVRASGSSGNEIVHPGPLEPKHPLGSLVYDPMASGAIDVPGAMQTFEIDVDPGQKLTAVVEPDASLHAFVEISTHSGRALASASAGAPGEIVLLQNVPTQGSLGKPGPNAKTFFVSVEGLDGTVGRFDLRLVLNAAVEEEGHRGAENDTIEFAEDLGPSFIPMLRAVDADEAGPHPDRGAVLGHMEGAFQTVALEDFESGALGPDFATFSSTPQGRIQVTGAFGTAAGSFALLMDTALAGPSNSNEAVLSVDLSGIPDAFLRFFHADFNDEEDPLPSDFVGSVQGDGVSISDDGISWHTVLGATALPFGTWTEVTIDLAAAAAAAGMSLGPDFLIKFQQFDNFPLTTDGRGYDEIAILVAGGGDLYRFDLEAGESATLALTGQTGDELRLDLLDALGDVVAEGIAPEERIENGSFESGDFAAWTEAVTGAAFIPWTVSGAGLGAGFGMATTAPQDGSFVAWNGFDGDGPMEFTLFQDLEVPDGMSSAVLQWQDRIQWNFTLGGTATLPRLYDVELRDPVTNAVLETLFSFSTGPQSTNPTGDTGWQTHTADLSAHAGSLVRLFFREQIPQSFTGPAQLEIDGVGFSASDPPTNVDDLVRNFRAEESSTYYARVNGAAGLDYSLLVLRNAEFDLEDNDDTDAAQEVVSPQAAGRKWVLGHLGAVAGALYGASRVGELFTIDLATGAGTLVGLLPGAASTEIEFDDIGQTAFTQLPDGFFQGQAFDIDTGAGAGPPVFTGAAFNGLEYVGTTLYGTAILGPRFPSTLRTLDPVTGSSSVIGATGVGPISGLAYDEMAAVMYGISGGPGPAILYTLDLASGAATPVGSTGFQAGSLEFGPDGALYGGGTGADAGNLFRIDPATAAATLVGATGFSTVTGLTLRGGAANVASDFYRVTLTETKPLEARTRTPADASGEFSNELDPVLNLYDALGNLVASDEDSAPDRRNARLSFKPRAGGAGSYFVEVASADETEGEYILSLKGVESRGKVRTRTAPAAAPSASESVMGPILAAQQAAIVGHDYAAGCGLGAELTLLLPPLLWMRARRRARRTAARG
jgi:hypothetical protein